MKCRGQQNRKNIIAQYDLKPIAYLKLLNGQQKKSCTGDILTDNYYLFTYKSKNGHIEGSFFCGSHAAAHFLELLGLSPLPLFNPLSGNSGTTNQGGKSTHQISTWHPTTKELLNAINLLIICWNTTIKGFLGKIKMDLENNPSKAPTLSDIKRVNTVLSRDSKNRTLQQMLLDLKKVEPTLRPFSFKNINSILVSEHLDSYFG